MAKVFVVLALLIVAAPVSAQEAARPSLKIPTTVFLTAAAADWVTTGAALSMSGFEERNPALSFTNSHPAGTVAALAASDVLGAMVINKWVAPRKPKIAKTLLYVFAGARVAMAAHNVRAMSAARAH